MGNSVAAETGVSTSIVHFYCTFRTEMSEWSGDGGPYLSEYEGELLVGLEDDVDEFRLAGRAKLFIVNPDAAEDEDDEEAPSLFELLDLRGETAAYLPLLHSTEPNMFSPAVRRILREDIGSSRNMLILDRLELLPAFRRQRLGLRYIRTAIKRFGSGCRIAALKPFPLQFERTLDDPDLEWRARMNLDLLSRETRSAKTTLKEYYSREGFIPVRGTDLMILDLGH
jgi:hypothetical protein